MIDLPPPTARPNNDGCVIKPKVPGSLKTGFLITGINSATLVGSILLAPTKVVDDLATKVAENRVLNVLGDLALGNVHTQTRKSRSFGLV